MRMKEDVMNNGQTKTDKQYKRFRHRGFSKIQMDFGILFMTFNLQKLIKNVGMDQIKGVMEAFLLYLACFWRLYGPFGRNTGKQKALSIKIGSYQIET